MLAVTIGLLLTLAIAVSILVVVALPNLRNGSRILTPEGERTLERAREQATQKPAAAAGQTWSLVRHRMTLTWRALRVARGRASQAWGPVSQKLHELFDKLEGRTSVVDDGKRASSVPSPSVVAAPGDETARVRHSGAEPVFPLEPAAPVSLPAEKAPIRHAGAPSRPGPTGPLRQRFDVAAIVGKRSVGRPRPIPPISGPIPVDKVPVDKVEAPVTGEETVIDLRDADQQTGSARHAR